jgi:phosphate starvation-inducible PhoH-like protein
MQSNKITLCEGPAGVGKSFLASLYGIDALQKGMYHKMIISRPLVQSGENTGYLPGGINEKLDPYIKPIYDILDYVLTSADLRKLIEDKRIEIVPFAYMRGRNFHNSFILLDEVQNCSYQQLVLALTRFAKNSKMVMTGDSAQSDLAPKDRGAFLTISRLLQNTPDIGVVKLERQDIVREPIIQVILEKLNEEKPSQEKQNEGFSS